MLTGKAKTDYQREYMRNMRKRKRGLIEQAGSNAAGTLNVRPNVRPVTVTPKPQSYNPMMVGYVRPEGMSK